MFRMTSRLINQLMGHFKMVPPCHDTEWIISTRFPTFQHLSTDDCLYW